MKNKKVILEKSTHTHVLTGNVITEKRLNNSMVLLHIEGNGLVTHEEHDSLVTNNPYVLKVVQQELNPVTQELQNAFD